MDPSLPLLRLTLTPGLGPVLIARLLHALGGAERVLLASGADLARVQGIGEARARAIAAGLAQSQAAADEELARAHAAGVTILALDDPRYPAPLRTTPDPPPVLYARGDLAALADLRTAIALVGSRRCTAYGVEQAERFAGVLCRAGVPIVSGGARGIDAAAHRGTLRAGGVTIAVVGSGLSRCYPPENAELFEQIVARRGLLLSELPMQTSPRPENFPSRNRLIAGLSRGVLVIEAADRSGALITARVAIDLGRDVYALPGRVDSPSSVGTHHLLKTDGALLVTEPADILTDIPAAPPAMPDARVDAASKSAPEHPLFGELTDDRSGWDTLHRPSSERSDGAEPSPTTSPPHPILRALSDGGLPLDRLADITGWDVGRLRAELTILEIQGRVRRAGPLIRLR